MGGATGPERECMVRGQRFQSTLPVGGATSGLAGKHDGRDRDFNPRSPWGERLLLNLDLINLVGISIHAPRGGSDYSPS